MINNLEGLNVQCPQCCRVLHTTTALYDPDKRAKGNMVELLPKWKKRGWRTFYGGGGSTTPAAAMQCPHCSGRLAPSGKLRIKPDPEPIKTQAQKNQEAIDAFEDKAEKPVNDLICKVCGKECKSKLGLHSHMRSHNG
jgi:hypothetical protein